MGLVTGESSHTHIGLFIDSMDPGGAEEVVGTLGRGLLNVNCRCTVFHFGNSWLSGRLAELGVNEVILSRSFYTSRYTLILFVLYFWRILKKHHVDVLHSHLLGAIFAGSVTARLARIPAIGTVHDVYSVQESPGRAKLLSLAYRFGSRLVAVADTMKVEIASRCNLPVKALTRIYNGIDVAAFRLAHKPVSGAEPVRIVAVSRAVRIKRIDLILEAAVQMSGIVPFRLTFIGDGPLLDEYKESAKSLGIMACCEFLGFRSDIPDVLAASDIYVQASDSEGLSISLLESMAAALPAIVTRVGGNPELVEEGSTGYLVEPGKSGQLAEKLQRLARDPESRNSMGVAARDRAERLFSVDAMVHAYVALYRNVLRADA